MTLLDIIQFVFPAGIGAAITGVVNYIVNRRRITLEADRVEAEGNGVELDNVEKAVAIWRSLANDLNHEITNLRNEIAKLRQENVELKEMIDVLRRRINAD